MTSVYVFGVIIAVLFIAGLVVAPLMEDEPADPNSPDGDASPGDRREAALDALEELQFEHETGKLSDEDYRRLKSKYARAAVEARRQEEADDETAADGAPSRCRECGTEADEGARFCARCGTELPT